MLLFHHVQRLADTVRAFADELRAGGHSVHSRPASSLPSYQPDAAALLLRRSLEFLDRIGWSGSRPLTLLVPRPPTELPTVD